MLSTAHAVRTLSTVLIATAMFLGGCGSQAIQAPHTGPRALMTDGDRYAECMYEAYRAYQAEVQAAEQFTYPSAAAASRTEVDLHAGRFDELLSNALRHHGLTAQGMQLHASRHPEFVDAQRTTYRARLIALTERAVAVSGQADQNSWAIALLDPEAGTQVASR